MLSITACKSTSSSNHVKNVCEEFPGHYPENYTFVPDVVKPIVKIYTAYPKKALSNNITGFVTMSFDVVHGNVHNIKVIESTPKELFEDEAIRALKKWKYQTTYKNCMAFPKVYSFTETIEFKPVKST